LKTWSEDKANAYFADGIQDEILTRLSKIADLKVISRTSTQHYRARQKTCLKLRDNSASHMYLRGSVQKCVDSCA
jgi:TolB-like protein